MDIKYFDNAATTRVDDDVVNYILPYMKDYYFNPSSLYEPSIKVKFAINEARERVAKVINAKSEEIYFTSGGSESDNLAIKGFVYANRKKGNHIITSVIEHPAVINSMKSLEKEGFEVTYLSVDENGLINLDELKSSIKDNTILISVMFANNEIGTIEPISMIGKIAHEKGICFHTDAVQAIGSEIIDVDKMNIDMLSLSGHKFYAPKGVGALYVRKGVMINRLNDGGHQEKGKRSGTENVPSIIGLGYAIEKAYNEFEENHKKIFELREHYINRILNEISDVKLNGHRNIRLCGNANISFKYIEGESILLRLSAKGICVSTGSACSSLSLEPSYVLLATGMSHELAHGSIRVSIGKYNTLEEIDYLVDSLKEVVGDLRKMSPLYKEVK